MRAGLLHFLRFRSHALTSSYNQIIRGLSNFFNLVQRIKNFLTKRVEEILVPYLDVVQRISYFAQQEYALIAMLGDDNENLRNVGVAKVLARRKQVTEESANNNNCPMHGTAV